MTDFFETPSDVIGIAEGEAKDIGLVKAGSQSISEAVAKDIVMPLADSVSFADSSLLYDVTMEVWWGNIKWRTACHGGL